MGEIIISLVETGIIFIYFHFVLDGENGGWKKQAIGAAAAAAMISVINACGIQVPNATVKAVGMIVIQTVYAYFCFGGTPFEKLVYGTSFSLVAIISEQVTFRLSCLMHLNNLDFLMMPGQIRYQMTAVYYVSCLLIALLAVALERSRMLLPFSCQVSLLILFVSVLISMDRLLRVVTMPEYGADYRAMIRLLKFVCILLSAAFFAAVYIVTRLSHIYQERNDLLYRQQQAEYVLTGCENRQESVTALCGWRHDMRSHLGTVFELIEGGNEKYAAQYIEGILGEMESGIILVNSGNPVLDAIITNKASRAKNAGIRFDYRIHSEYVMPLSPGEMTAMLGNILDNAIDAAIKIRAGEKRYIFLEIKSVNLMIHIVAENSLGSEPYREADGFKSTKGYGHGIGLSQIKRIAKKYGGFISYEMSERFFKISVYLPMAQEDE